MTYQPCSAGKSAPDTPAKSQGIMDEVIELADMVGNRLARIDRRLEERVDRFYGAEARNIERASDQDEFAPGVLGQVIGRARVMMERLGQIEQKLERLEQL